MRLFRILFSLFTGLFIFFIAEGLGQNSPVMHMVEPGETLYALSRKYNITVSDIKNWNRMTSNNISVGEKLIVGYQASRLDIQPSTSDHTSQRDYHIVKPGETLYALSRKYNVSVQQIQSWNNMSTNELQVGRQVRINNNQKVNPIEENPVASESAIPESGNPRDESGEFLVYSQAVKNGDEALAEGLPEAALSFYQTAQAIMPEMKYPQQKILEIEESLKAGTHEVADAETDADSQPVPKESGNYALYFEAVERADMAFAKENYSQALEFYREALNILPQMIYPQRKIEEAEGLIDVSAEKSEKESGNLYTEEKPEIISSDAALSVEETETSLTENNEKQVDVIKQPADQGIIAFTDRKSVV